MSTCLQTKNNCRDCKIELKTLGSTRCKRCSNLHRWQTNKGEWADSISKANKARIYLCGKKARNYIDGLSLKSSYCCDCKKKLSRLAAYNGFFRCNSCNRKHQNSTFGNPMTGRSHSTNTKEKISNTRISTCVAKGSNNPAWLGGKSFEQYPKKFNPILKDFIRERDGFACKICKLPENAFNRKLSIHHIDYNKKNCSPDNLVSLCVKCHGATNTNRPYWSKMWNLKIEVLKDLPETDVND